MCPRPESNRQPRGFKPCRSSSWRTRASSPGWTRTTDRHLVRVLPSPLGHGTALLDRAEADHPPAADGARIRTHKRLIAATCFQDRIPGTDRRLVAAGSLPFISLKVPGVGIEPTSSWFRARRHYQQQLPRNKVSPSSGRRNRTGNRARQTNVCRAQGGSPVRFSTRVRGEGLEPP